MKHVRIAMMQMNATVGDIQGNTTKILQGLQQAKDVQADIVTFPELAITGYPPQDLLLKPQFLQENRAALDQILEATQGITSIVGFVDQQDDIYNAAAILHDRQLLGIQHKVYLPNYGVFDENRYFQAGVPRQIFQIGDVTWALLAEIDERSRANRGGEERLRNRLGLLYARYGLFAKAEAEFQKVLSRGEYVPALINLGNIYYIKKDYQTALRYLQRAQRQQPENPVVVLSLARLSYEAEDYAAAREAHGKLASLEPELADRFSYLSGGGDTTRRAADQYIKEVPVWTE